jgi:peptidoglycan/LPS O-acetylase OafA/YrhL
VQINDRLYTLDAMRGIAAILVVLYHLSDVAFRVAPGGYLAVDFFFALSGFVLAKAYSQPLGRGLTTKNFMIKRAIRLYPLFVIGLGFALIKAASQIVVGDDNALDAISVVGSLVTETLMLPSPFGGEDLFPLNGPAWSLFFELVINLALALWLVQMRPLGLKLVMLTAGIFVVLAAFDHGSLNVGWNWSTSWAGLARVTFAFTAGVILYRMKVSPVLETKASVVPVIVLIGLLILPIARDWRPLFDSIAALLIAPALLRLGLVLQPPRVLRRSCEFLGDVSYPVYAIHFPLLFIAGFGARKLDIAPILWVPIFIIGLVVFAWLLGRYVDVPMRSFLTSNLLPRRASAQAR